MKKSDKLFSDEFVHFRWNDALESRKGFVSDSIDTLERTVDSGGMKELVLHKSESNAYPFVIGDGTDRWKFAYYDPHYELKKAWMEGKRVQYMTTIYAKNDWKDVPDEWYWDGNDGTQYRIAPEKEWRPFKDVDELKYAWENKWDHLVHPELVEPMIWVRSKSNTKSTYLITHYCENVGVVYLCGYLNVSLEQLFDDYTFLDGSPLGVLELVEEEE